MDLTARLDAMEAAIKKPSFRQSSGKANEVNYWIFDYPPEKELEVRERIEYMKNKNQKGTDEYQLDVFPRHIQRARTDSLQRNQRR